MILFFMLFKTFSNMLEFSREVRNPSDCFFIKSVTTEDIFKVSYLQMLRKLLKAMTFQPKSTKTIPVFFLNFFKQTLMKLLKQVFFQSKEVLYKAMKNIFVESNVKMLMQKQFLK